MSESGDSGDCTPPDILEAASNMTMNLLPAKSRSNYNKCYHEFMEWKMNKNATSFSENVFLAYFQELSEKYKVSTRGPSYTVNGVSDHKKPYLEVRNSTYHGSGPREEARAMCSVKTAEVNATANATITRRLHGVVTSRELHSSIQRLEVIIFGQMQQLWQTLDALRAQISGESQASFPDRRTMVFRYKPGVD